MQSLLCIGGRLNGQNATDCGPFLLACDEDQAIHQTILWGDLPRLRYEKRTYHYKRRIVEAYVLQGLDPLAAERILGVFLAE